MFGVSGRSIYIRHPALGVTLRSSFDYSVAVLDFLILKEKCQPESYVVASEIMSGKFWPEGSMLEPDGTLAQWVYAKMPEITEHYEAISNYGNNPFQAATPSHDVELAVVAGTVGLSSMHLAALLNGGSVPELRVPDVNGHANRLGMATTVLRPTPSHASGYGQIPRKALRELRVEHVASDLLKLGMATTAEPQHQPGKLGRKATMITLTKIGASLVDAMQHV